MNGSLTETVWLSCVRTDSGRSAILALLSFLFFGFLVIFLGKCCQNFAKILECFMHVIVSTLLVHFQPFYYRYADEILSHFGQFMPY